MEEKGSKKNLFKFSNTVILFLLILSIAVFGIVGYSVLRQESKDGDDKNVSDLQPAQLYVLRRDPVVTALGNNEYEIEITFFVRNNNSREVININGSSNVQFAGNYSLINQSSDNLALNPNYNATTDSVLLTSGQTLAPGEISNLTYTFRANSSTLNGLSQFLMSMNISGSSIVPPPSDTGGGTNSGGGTQPVPNDPVNTTPPSDIETNLAPRTFQYRLMNADTGEVIGTINEGDTIDVATLPTRNFTIEAIPNININGSVRFALNGNNNYRNENNPGYYLSGNTGSLFDRWNYNLGTQSLNAIAHAARNGQGTVLGNTLINFTLIDSNPGGGNSQSGTGVNSGSADVSVDLDFNNSTNNEPAPSDNTNPDGSQPVSGDSSEDSSNTVATDNSARPTLPNTGIEMPNIITVGLLILSVVISMEALTFYTSRRGK